MEMEQEALSSLKQCENHLTSSFFSPTNVAIIQQRLRDRVACKTGYAIEKQNEQNLFIIMRGIFILNANYPSDPIAVPAEVRRLNDLVLEELTPMVLGNLAAYMGYLRDSQNPLVPLPRGSNTSAKGSNTFAMFPKI